MKRRPKIYSQKLQKLELSEIKLNVSVNICEIDFFFSIQKKQIIKINNTHYYYQSLLYI